MWAVSTARPRGVMVLWFCRRACCMASGVKCPNCYLLPKGRRQIAWTRMEVSWKGSSMLHFPLSGQQADRSLRGRACAVAVW